MGLFGNWRRKAPEESVPPAEEERYLEFDSFPFKLAVVQELMYEQKLLGEPYRGGDAFMERYAGDLETISEETALQRLLPHIEEAEAYFRALKIPASLAGQIKSLYVGEELDIYYQINPQWGDFDCFEDGAAFDIKDITEREIRQFPNLKEALFFNMYHDPPEALLQKLEGWGYAVKYD